jgi:hypothetical protein
MELCSSDKFKARQFLERASAFFWANFSSLQTNGEKREKRDAQGTKVFFF